MNRLGLFIEYLKRIAALGMTVDIVDDVQREERLIEIFTPQLKKLFGVSRPVRDWVQDQILNPAGNGKAFFELGEAVEALPDNYHLLGSSPQLFRDLSWYKDVRYPKRVEIQKEIKKKLATLFLAGSSEVCLDEAAVESLENSVKVIMAHGFDFEEKRNKDDLYQIAMELHKMENLIIPIGDRIHLIIQEAVDCFTKLASGEKVDFEPYPHWASAFGRTMSYMAASRDMEYA